MKPFYERDNATIYCGECSSVMADVLPDDSIDLVITSPPYDNLRTYDGYEFDLEAIAQQLWRVTKPGGVVVWVVADATIDGSETGTSFRQALYFMELGFKLHDTMIYDKNGFRYPFPDKYHQVFEYMFIFCNGRPKSINLISDRKNSFPEYRLKRQKRERDGSITFRGGNRIKEHGKRFNIWRYSGGEYKTTADKIAFDHPAIFPEALARDHIISWSNPGDVVLDPMCGSGTTLKMAMQLGRPCIGIEISEEYCKIAVERLRQPSLFSILRPESKPEAKQLRIEE